MLADVLLVVDHVALCVVDVTEQAWYSLSNVWLSCSTIQTYSLLILSRGLA